jgi:hypothetical protein
VKAFLDTFGGTSTKQAVVAVTPTPSSTSSQLLQTLVGTVSLFGLKTPVPNPFGRKSAGYFAIDLERAIVSAKSEGLMALWRRSLIPWDRCSQSVARWNHHAGLLAHNAFGFTGQT